MIKLAWASIRGHWARFVMTAVAVALGVAFVTGSIALSDNMTKTFSDMIASDTRGKDVVVSLDDGEGGAASSNSREAAQTRPLPLNFTEKLAAVEGAKSSHADIRGPAILVNTVGKATGSGQPPSMAFPGVSSDPAIEVQEGRLPESSSEIAVEASTLAESGHTVGNKADVIIAGDRKTYTIVGKVSLGGATGLKGVFLETQTAEKLFAPDGVAVSFRIEAKPGVSQESLLAKVKEIVPKGYVADTGKQVSKKEQELLVKELKPITLFFLVFAFVALVVGSFIIVNTFLMILAQRSRELAMLRAIGTKSRQIVQMVLFEAVMIAIAGSLLGLLLGLGVALALVWFISNNLGVNLGSNIPITPKNIVVSLSLGLLVTLGSALIPAIKAARTAPIEAMRASQTTERKPLKVRMLFGAVLIVIGLLGYGIYFANKQSGWLSLAAIGLVAGTVTLAAGLVQPLIRPLAALAVGFQKVLRRPTAVTELAQDNTVRNPRRTALTATSLLIGVALVTGSTAMATGLEKSFESETTKNLKAPLLVSVGGGKASPELMGKISKTEGVDAAVKLTGAKTVTSLKPKNAKDVRKTPDGNVIPETVRIQGLVPEELSRVFRLDLVSGNIDTYSNETALVDEPTAKKYGLSVGSTVVLGPEESVAVRITGIFEAADPVPGLVLTPESAKKLMESHDSYTRAIYVLPKPGTNVDSVKAALTSEVEDLLTVKVKDIDDLAKSGKSEVQRFLVLIYALLGLSIVIAALGIANTLAMAIYERTREIGMLRALGLKRHQLGAMVILESVWTAVFGAVLGVVLGLPLGVFAAAAIFDVAVADVDVPWGTAIGVLIAAAVVGVIAALVPAIRVMRMKVLDSIAAI